MRVPFCTWTHYKTREVSTEMLSYPEEYRDGFEWRELGEFDAQMAVTSIERGRSAARFILVDVVTLIKYPMFMVSMLDLLHKNVVTCGRVYTTWEPCKKGANYGLMQSKSVKGLTSGSYV